MTGSKRGRDDNYYPQYRRSDSGPAINRKINRGYQGISKGKGFQGAGRSGRSGKSENKGGAPANSDRIVRMTITDGGTGDIELNASSFGAAWLRFNFKRGSTRGMGLIVVQHDGSSASAELLDVWFNHPEIDGITAAVASGTLTITIDAGTHGNDLQLVISIQGVEVIT